MLAGGDSEKSHRQRASLFPVRGAYHTGDELMLVSLLTHALTRWSCFIEHTICTHSHQQQQQQQHRRELRQHMNGQERTRSVRQSKQEKTHSPSPKTHRQGGLVCVFCVSVCGRRRWSSQPQKVPRLAVLLAEFEDARGTSQTLWETHAFRRRHHACRATKRCNNNQAPRLQKQSWDLHQ